MAIRSAWEIALERSESIVVDKDKLKKDEDILKVRGILGRYLSDDEGLNIEKLNEFNKAIKDEAFLLVISQNLTIPSEQVNENRMAKIVEIAKVASEKEEFRAHVNNIIAFIKQYPNHKSHLIEQITAQFKTMIAEKSNTPNADINLDNNKEFQQILNTQLEKLSANYFKTLDESKKQLAALL